MEFGINSLRLILLWNFLCARSYTHKTAARSDIYEGNTQQSPELLSGKTNPLQVNPINSVHIHAGHTLELQCRDEGNEGLAQWWQTPFGLFEGCNYGNKDPVETCNGSLKISRITSSHNGFYFCIRLEETGKTILPYRVYVMGLNPTHNAQRRKTRETKPYADGVSDSHFITAVTSSVIVTFLVAFTFGVFSRSYVIKCLQMTRAHIPYRKNYHETTSGNDNSQPTTNTQPLQLETVFFHKNQDDGEDTVDIVASHVYQDCVEQESKNVGEVDGEKDDSNQLQTPEGEQNQKSTSVLSPHPKKKSRVIKLYNYDEEGTQYSHIKDSGGEVEDEVMPKLRTKSLTRLSTIMKQAESLDFNPVKESTDVQMTPNAPSYENCSTTTAGDGNIGEA
ncbi:uncharacterized protein LOC127623139 [Xyrauchen texanus]|uniref:uncharacterized protein LOC127623139 n=1 Tax=Xyrauchen texanus TaxID=154827 RepID=UPI00224212ED|nr:uncharacterized protein LOC127623139 [Xyrauchen texanus]